MTQPSTNGATPASSGRTPAQGNRLDPWFDAYAERAHNLRESEIRALFSVVSRPEVVSLAGGMPNLKDLPLDKLAASAEKLVRNHGAQAMQYGSGQGWEVLRERITEVMTYDGIIGADPDDVVVTTGSQQALDLVTELFVNPGDVILAEAPSYVGALGVFRARQADVVHVPMDEHGIIPEALVETIRDVRASGRTIKFIYIIPNYHNPAGVTLSAERRPIIAEICLREHVLIVEDIIDSGLTLSWLQANLIGRGAASVNIATALRKPAAAKVDIDVTYVGFDIPDEFVVGYGLDYAEKYRNLPFVGRRSSLARFPRPRVWRSFRGPPSRRSSSTRAPSR